MVGSRVSSRMRSPVSAWMTVISRSWIRSRTGVPFQARPSPMWCRRPPWRRVTVPSLTLSVRTRLWVRSAGSLEGLATGRAA